ncbi:MAG: tRNA dihydrouridine synthase DusB [Clostridia bacterium]|jgi:tRNA-dihydrouridine synthase B|uniref:tRNA dihydrouridine synthase DusB n=1 Tax=Petroclostridium xylanilyticum TaxID=1792311 RepID=UPI000B98FB82|nr:tRNA dihydrouridine synthase DusB [Petroclostridium xylanilyticum]MBZ4646203.1 tRNA dihydrouridine synthase DusB [Clostridia bacterium]
MQIGNIQLQNNVFLAPMAGVTDLPFRLLCKEQGCGLVYTEMVSAKGLYYEDKKTETLLQIDEREKPVAVQIFGSDPDIMAQIANEAASTGASIVDINMGCPTPKIVKNGEGSALMLNPNLVGRIVKAVSQAVHLPVTVKVRKGWDEGSINADEIAMIAEENGAKAVTVHGRTREQFYSGKADWDIIKQVKQSVKIPVIGNGDIVTPEDAKKMLEYTGCDGIMIGRGAQGNPWIFSRVIHYLNTGELLPEPTPQEKINKAIENVRLLVQYKGEYVGIREARKHVAWYIKGLRNAARVKEAVNRITTLSEMENLLREYGSDVE